MTMKEVDMHPWTLDQLVRQHITELHYRANGEQRVNSATGHNEPGRAGGRFRWRFTHDGRADRGRAATGIV
jgi:hypothetical protein